MKNHSGGAERQKFFSPFHLVTVHFKPDVWGKPTGALVWNLGKKFPRWV